MIEVLIKHTAYRKHPTQGRQWYGDDGYEEAWHLCGSAVNDILDHFTKETGR